MEKEKEMTPLSASRIKTAESCSWEYYCKYILKMPDRSNHGSSRGTICHLVFECLGNPRHKKHYDQLTKGESIFDNASIEKLVLKHAKILEVDDPENLQMIDEMIMNGLQYDFFGKARHPKGKMPDEGISEKDFDIKVDKDGIRYRIRGFIDKLFLYRADLVAIIRDFKSSKETFKGKELTDNLQDLVYSLAVKHLYPEFFKRQSEFLFLKFKMDENDLEDSEGVVLMEAKDEEELKGFEVYLTEVQRYIDNFDERTAVKNFARHQYGGMIPKDKGFVGCLKCGVFCKFKGQLKKDGTKRWHCPYRFSCEYLAMVDEETNEVVKSAFIDESEKLIVKQEKNPEKYRLELRHYDGCPAWKSDPCNTSSVEF